MNIPTNFEDFARQDEIDPIEAAVMDVARQFRLPKQCTGLQRAIIKGWRATLTDLAARLKIWLMKSCLPEVLLSMPPRGHV